VPFKELIIWLRDKESCCDVVDCLKEEGFH